MKKQNDVAMGASQFLDKPLLSGKPRRDCRSACLPVLRPGSALAWNFRTAFRVSHNVFREFDALVPEGPCENSPAFQRWVVGFKTRVRLHLPGTNVAQTSGLSYRGLTVGRAPEPATRLDFCNAPRHEDFPCRSQTGDTADRRSALQVAFVTASFNRTLKTTKSRRDERRLRFGVGFLPSLRDLSPTSPQPSVQTLGYGRMSLRDKLQPEFPNIRVSHARTGCPHSHVRTPISHSHFAPNL